MIRPSSDAQKINRTFQFLDIRGHSFYCHGCPPMGEIIGSRQQARTARTHLGRRFVQRFGPPPFQCWGRAHRCHVHLCWPNSLKRGDAKGCHRHGPLLHHSARDPIISPIGGTPQIMFKTHLSLLWRTTQMLQLFVVMPIIELSFSCSFRRWAGMGCHRATAAPTPHEHIEQIFAARVHMSATWYHLQHLAAVAKKTLALWAQ